MAGDELVPLDHHWLALCLCTESNRRREWPLIAAVIQNRVRSSRYPDTFVEVILQPSQFSAFNPYTADADVRHRWRNLAALWLSVAATLTRKQLALHLAYAIDHAAKMLEADVDGHRISDLVSPATLHYFSPISMKPVGSAPAWAKTASRLYTPAGIDPQRFIFAENVP